MLVMVLNKTIFNADNENTVHSFSIVILDSFIISLIHIQHTFIVIMFILNW